MLPDPPPVTGGIPIAIIAGVAVGGGTVLAGAGWVLYRFMLLTPTAAPVAAAPAVVTPTNVPLVQPEKAVAASYNPAAVRLHGRFIEYQV